MIRQVTNFFEFSMLGLRKGAGWLLCKAGPQKSSLSPAHLQGVWQISAEKQAAYFFVRGAEAAGGFGCGHLLGVPTPHCRDLSDARNDFTKIISERAVCCVF